MKLVMISIALLLCPLPVVAFQHTETLSTTSSNAIFARPEDQEVSAKTYHASQPFSPSFSQSGSSAKSMPQYSCPENYALQGEKCMRFVEVAAETVCGSGAFQNGVCVSYGPLAATCPSGFSQDNGRCSMTQSMTLVPTCPPNYRMEGGECVQWMEAAPSAICQNGVLMDGACVVTMSESPHLQCPPNAVPNGDSCMATETFDCTGAVMMQPAQAARKHEKRKGLFNHDCGSCQHDSMVMPVMATPVSVVQQTCERQVAMAGSFVCPGGSMMQGMTCVREVRSHPAFRCPDGSPAQGGSCKSRNLKGVVYGCPNGGQLLGQPRRLKEVRELFGKKHCNECKCEGNACGGTTLVVAPQYYMETQQPRVAQNIGQCSETVEQQFVCPGGAQMVQDRCVATSNPILRCPEGLRLTGNRCTATQMAEPLAVYSETFTYTCVGIGCSEGRASPPMQPAQILPPLQHPVMVQPQMTVVVQQPCSSGKCNDGLDLGGRLAARQKLKDHKHDC